MLFQSLCKPERIFILPLDTKLERLQASVQQVCHKRIGTAAEIFSRYFYFVDDRLRAYNNTCENIGVSPQIFRRAFHHDVDAGIERLLVQTRCKSIVDHRQDSSVIFSFGLFHM